MGSIRDIDGVLIGHWTDEKAKTGCTAILFPEGAVAGVDVRGAAPGTRETDLLSGYHLVEKIYGIMLSGGSAFGLAAADGAMRYLEENKIGFLSGENIIPIVPAAVLYDLEQGSSTIRPDSAAGYQACKQAGKEAKTQGRIGAGTGATVGKMLGMESAMPAGMGSACIDLPGGIKVAALLAANALGDVFDHRNGKQLAGPVVAGRMQNTVDLLLQNPQKLQAAGNTTIGAIITNAKLNREQMNRMATMGHDGLALTIRPVHTPFDGDTLFAASTGEKEADADMLALLFVAATEAVAKAVINVFKSEEEE